MNPFTRFLSRKMKRPELAEFIDHWDRLEALVIAINKGESAAADVEAEYQLIRQWLLSYYPLWQAALERYWPQALVAGQPARRDPFQRLFTTLQAADFDGDWEAMQHLPAAREALNRLIIEGGASG